MSITQLLHELGYSHHQKGNTPQHWVTHKGKNLFCGNGFEIIAWLKNEGLLDADGNPVKPLKA